MMSVSNLNRKRSKNESQSSDVSGLTNLSTQKTDKIAEDMKKEIRLLNTRIRATNQAVNEKGEEFFHLYFPNYQWHNFAFSVNNNVNYAENLVANMFEQSNYKSIDDKKCCFFTQHLFGDMISQMFQHCCLVMASVDECGCVALILFVTIGWLEATFSGKHKSRPTDIVSCRVFYNSRRAITRDNIFFNTLRNIAGLAHTKCGAIQVSDSDLFKVPPKNEKQTAKQATLKVFKQLLTFCIVQSQQRTNVGTHSVRGTHNTVIVPPKETREIGVQTNISACVPVSVSYATPNIDVTNTLPPGMDMDTSLTMFTSPPISLDLFNSYSHSRSTASASSAASAILPPLPPALLNNSFQDVDWVLSNASASQSSSGGSPWDSNSSSSSFSNTNIVNPYARDSKQARMSVNHVYPNQPQMTTPAMSDNWINQPTAVISPQTPQSHQMQRLQQMQQLQMQHQHQQQQNNSTIGYPNCVPPSLPMNHSSVQPRQTTDRELQLQATVETLTQQNAALKMELRRGGDQIQELKDEISRKDQLLFNDNISLLPNSLQW